MRSWLVALVAVTALAACGGGSDPDPFTLDTDHDGISDGLEGSTQRLDTDGDGTPDFQDLDADGDCVPDEAESGLATPPRDTDGDGRPDFQDRDSDGDGLADGVEDANCSGGRDGSESSATSADTDGDGASDLVESAGGTDPLDPTANPAAQGDLVFLLPYQGPAAPADLQLPFRPALSKVDLYVVLDRSGSMLAEATSIRDNLAAVVNGLTCPPLGSGDPATCVPDLWAGAGTVGYSGSGADTFRNHVDLQPNPSFAALPLTEPAGCCAEPLTFAVWAAVTGNGTSLATGCGLSGVNPRATCAGSPADLAGYTSFGYPCFRDGALPVVLLATDEPPVSTGDPNKCPNWSAVVAPALQSRGVRLVGVLGSAPAAGTQTDLQAMATATGAVDASNGNAPLVFAGADATAATAIQDGLRTLIAGVPLDLGAVAFDDPTDGLDAVATFLARLEVRSTGTAECTGGLTAIDSDADGFQDQYVDVRVGTPVCWGLVANPNTTVPATAAPQVFQATVAVIGDGVTELDSRRVLFIVPPTP